MTEAQFIAEANELYDDYGPNGDVDSKLGLVDATTITGPSGVGKDSLRVETGLPIVVSDTIRGPRENNGVLEVHGREYFFRGHELEATMADLRVGNYVQIGMGPGRKGFYGTRLSSYPAWGPALLDVIAEKVEPMRDLPFASFESAFVVAQSSDAWLQRFDGRGKTTPEERVKRLVEAEQSLQTGLDDERYVFIVNEDLPLAAQTLARLAVEREVDKVQSTKGRNIAAAILRDLKAA